MLSEKEICSYSTSRIEEMIVQANEQLNTMLKEMAQPVKVLQYKEIDHLKEKLKNELINRRIQLINEVRKLDESVSNADNWKPNNFFSFKENSNIQNSDDNLYSHQLNTDLHSIPSEKVKEEKKRVNPQALIEKYRMMLEAQSGNILFYKGIHIPGIKPRAFSCLFVLGRHATQALSVKTLYEKAIEYEVDANNLDPYSNNIADAWVIRSEIREALYEATESYRDRISKEEVKSLLNSDKTGKIRLQIPKKDVLAIGPLDEYPCR